MKLIFKKICDDDEFKYSEFKDTSLTMKTKNDTLPYILEDFVCFLKGCGFNPRGTLMFVEDEEDV